MSNHNKHPSRPLTRIIAFAVVIMLYLSACSMTQLQTPNGYTLTAKRTLQDLTMSGKGTNPDGTTFEFSYSTSVDPAVEAFKAGVAAAGGYIGSSGL